jgi:hypothetical protein
MRSSRSSDTGCDAQALRRPRDHVGYVRRNVGLRASIANLNVRRQTIITDADLPIWDISNPRWCEHKLILHGQRLCSPGVSEECRLEPSYSMDAEY